MKTKQITCDDIAKAIGLSDGRDPDTLSLSKGVFTLRKSYYWRPKKTPEESFENTIALLVEAGYTVQSEFGDHYAAFKGGESLKKNSHYWMKFKVFKI